MADLMTDRNRARSSGIVASFNQSAYIEESVLSLAPQVDELVVVDDCSEDDSVERVQSLGLSNVRILSMTQRSGVSRACNLAIESTDAEIIVFQGGDDRSLPGRVERHIADLGDREVMVSASMPSIIDSRGLALTGTVAEEFATPPPSDDPLRRMVFDGNFICAPTTAMRRADYLNLGGYPVGIDLLQDHALWLRALSVGRLAISTQSFAEYRKHGTNTSRSYVGVDSPRKRRHAAELEYLITSFIEQAPDDVLNRLSAAVGLDVFAEDPESRLASRALLLLTHDNRVVQRRGLNLLFRLVQEVGSWESLAALSVTPQLLDVLSQAVDHEGSGDVELALRSASQLAKNMAANR